MSDYIKIKKMADDRRKAYGCISLSDDQVESYATEIMKNNKAVVEFIALSVRFDTDLLKVLDLVKVHFYILGINVDPRNYTDIVRKMVTMYLGKDNSVPDGL